MSKDLENLTYTHNTSSVYDENQQIKSFQLEKYLPIIDSIKEFKPDISNTTLLDVGIGYGVFLKLCEESGFENLFGMDPFPESIKISSSFTSAKLSHGKIEDTHWPYQNQSFDIITSFDVVEHLENPDQFYKHALKYLKPNGIIIVRTPNGGIAYKLRKTPLLGVKDPNPTHINVHPKKYWDQLALNNNFKILKSWKGEHLTHIKFLPRAIGKILKIFKIDHRKVPLLNAFEQAYIHILRPE